MGSVNQIPRAKGNAEVNILYRYVQIAHTCVHVRTV